MRTLEAYHEEKRSLPSNRRRWSNCPHRIELLALVRLHAEAYIHELQRQRAYAFFDDRGSLSD
jgi:hypothetical protein